ncbi:MAG TPA: hypothetical protein VFJ90_05500 [Candidatus Didemnitutus sp.]|nr:hypothetical protein [Candidatus Didemnitutus sp.]
MTVGFCVLTAPSSFSPPLPDYFRIKLVSSFAELVATPFSEGINAACWPRMLPGDFAEIAAKIGGEGIVSLDEVRLESLALSAAGRIARDVLLADLQLLRASGLAPELNCIHAYPRDDDAAVVSVDVHSFHADSAPVAASTYLCTYHGPTSEGLRNEDAQRRIDISATRAALRREYGGDDDEGFREFLREQCYDLHYAAAAGAQPYSFGIGHLWRIAIDWPGSPVPPCVHRAPAQLPGQTRLLLIS